MGRVLVRSKAGQKDQPKPEMVRLERIVDKVPYVTGFCGNGWHEGTNKFSTRGARLRSCSGDFTIQGKLYICRCNCHEAFRQIKELTGLTIESARAFAPVAEQPIESDMPEDFMGSVWLGGSGFLHDVRTDTREPSRSPLAVTTQPEAPAPTTPTYRHIPTRRIPPSESFSATKSGIRAKGQLEAEVAAVMLKWFQGGNADGSVMGLTPDAVKAAIKTEPSPSVGAIYSIFQRWDKQAWCELASKPFRMAKPTDLGRRQLARWSE